MKKVVWIISLLLLFGLIAGCSDKESKPEDRFIDYVKLWNEQKFDKMYDFLSTDSKEKVAKKDFVERYKKIYNDLSVEDLAIKFNKPEEETDKKT